jgi:signal peptidase II
MLTWILIILGVVALDQATKHLVMNFLDRENPFVLIPGVFRFNYHENPAAAMGMFEDHRWVFMTVSTIGIIVLFVYLWKFRPDSKLACTALSMIIGGGIGNMIDRCFYKGTLPRTVGRNVVIDFLDFYAFPDIWSYIFNVADAFVCVGAGILMVWCVYSIVQETKAEKAKKAAATQDISTEEEKTDNKEEKQ